MCIKVYLYCIYIYMYSYVCMHACMYVCMYHMHLPSTMVLQHSAVEFQLIYSCQRWGILVMKPWARPSRTSLAKRVTVCPSPRNWLCSRTPLWFVLIVAWILRPLPVSHVSLMTKDWLGTSQSAATDGEVIFASCMRGSAANSLSTNEGFSRPRLLSPLLVSFRSRNRDRKSVV